MNRLFTFHFLVWSAATLTTSVSSYMLPLGTTRVYHLGASPYLRSKLVRNVYSPPRLSNLSNGKNTKSHDLFVSVNHSEDPCSEPIFEGLGKGVTRDYKARFSWFLTDIKDGFNMQCLAAIFFLFFACLAPAVGFGGLFQAATKGAIGTIEMVSSTAFCGMIYSLFAAQPLTIIGSTGPVLAFVAVLVQLSESINVPFLPFYAWTGLWTSLLLFLSTLSSASNIVRYLTRFTDEIFSALISTIFIVEAISDVGGTFTSPASNLTKALLTLTIALTTYGTATVLKGIRNSNYFNRSVRNNISNFAPTVAVVFGSFLARSARLAHGAQAALPNLNIPKQFAPTCQRPWLIPLSDLPVWARWAAIVPALMAYILLFLDQNITVRVVNNPQYLMEKGRRKGNVLDGMHADLLVISFLTALTSLLGLPWLVAATVRSISHVRALAKYDTSGKFVGTIEQRVTGFSIHALIGSCVFFAKPRSWLSLVPLPVLMGLFMYLGTSALPGNEMYERIKRLFMDKREAKKERWSNIPNSVVTVFTLFQVACLYAMFLVKESSIGVLFPIVIAMLSPLRFCLEKFGIIKKEYMDTLDAE